MVTIRFLCVFVWKCSIRRLFFWCWTDLLFKWIERSNMSDAVKIGLSEILPRGMMLFSGTQCWKPGWFTSTNTNATGCQLKRCCDDTLIESHGISLDKKRTNKVKDHCGWWWWDQRPKRTTDVVLYPTWYLSHNIIILSSFFSSFVFFLELNKRREVKLAQRKPG